MKNMWEKMMLYLMLAFVDALGCKRNWKRAESACWEYYETESNFFCKNDIIGFVFPTYMSDLPWIVKEFLLKLTVNPDCYTFVVMTSNNGKSGNSFVSLSQALSRSGANLSAVFDLQMPGNCLISSEQENLERLKKAPERLKSIISFIKEQKTNFTSDGSLPKEDFVTASYFYGGHSCAACYACLHWCPKNATLLKVPFLKHRPQYHHPDVTLAEIKE